MLFRATVCSLVFLSFALAADAPVEAEVKKLVEKLKDPKQAKAAASKLIELGPDILPHLPAAAALTPGQKKHVSAVRQALNQAIVVRDLAASPLTLKAEVPLSKALMELKKQSGVALLDRRLSQKDPLLKLDLDRKSFWEVADALASLADARVSLYEGDQQLALRAGPYRAVPTSLHGIFRTQVKDVVTRRDFEINAHVCELGLELAWEPRFQPLFMYRPSNIVIKDDKGATLQVFPLGSGRDQITSRYATRIPLRVQAPPRDSLKLSLVKGEVALVGPAKMLDFTFNGLDKLDPKAAPARTQDGIRVILRKLVVEKNRWSASLELDYPAEGPEFESFEQWLINTQAFLVDKAGRRFGTDRFENPDQTGHRALMIFHFQNGENGLALTRPADFTLLLHTPGRIATVPVPFEFKDVELP